jgi:hypothetical protein
MNVAGVLTKKQRFEGTQNGCEAGCEETLTEADDCFVGFDVDKSPIEIPFDDRGLEANDFQRPALVFIWCPRERLHPLHNDMLSQAKIISGLPG